MSGQELLGKAARIIEGYAESYDRMGRISESGKVDCSSVAYDLRRNIAVQVRAAIIEHQNRQAVPEGYVLVKKPTWRRGAPDNGGEYVCCGGYAPCRGECAAFVPVNREGGQSAGKGESKWQR